MSLESSQEAGGSDKPDFSARTLFISALTLGGCRGFGVTPQYVEYMASLPTAPAGDLPAEQAKRPTANWRDHEDIRWLQGIVATGDDIIELVDPGHAWHSPDHCKADPID